LEGASHHAFRKGFKSGLLRAGAPPDAVDHLQGHDIGGSQGRYIDPMIAYDLVEVVGRVPESNNSSESACQQQVESSESSNRGLLCLHERQHARTEVGQRIGKVQFWTQLTAFRETVRHPSQ